MLTALGDSLARGGLNAAYRDAVHFPNFRKATQTMDDFVVQFDPSPRKAGGRMKHGGASPDALAAVLC